MKVAIAESLHDFVLARTQECGCKSVDEYVGRLVEADRQSRQQRLESELLRGLASERMSASAQDFEHLRETVRQRQAHQTQQ